MKHHPKNTGPRVSLNVSNHRHPFGGRSGWVQWGVQSLSPVLRRGFILLATLLVGALPTQAVTVNELANDAAGTSSFTGATNWDNGLIPTAGNDYISIHNLRTPGDANAYTFAGDSLTLNPNGLLAFKGSNVVTVANLILNGGGFQQTSTSVSPDWARFAGNITLTANSFLNALQVNQTLEIQAPITGNNDLGIYSVASFGGVVLFSTANPNYTGNLTIANFGDLALGANASIDNAASLTINAKCVFDVSAINAYVLSGNTVLTASGFGRSIGSTAATIKGAANGTVSLGAQAITFNYGPTVSAMIPIIRRCLLPKAISFLITTQSPSI